MLSAQKAEEVPLLISSTSDIHGSVANDTVVQRNCSLHVRGNLLGSLTIERGAKVVVEGSVDGKILNKGGRLVVNNKGLATYVSVDGPPEAEACGVLRINLSALVANWAALAKRTEAECAAVVKANAYGCGIGPVAGALARSGCKTFFVSNLPEARRVRAVAPNATIYVLNGLYPGSGPAFAEVDARPVINSPIEMAQWDAFVATSHWPGRYAINVDTGACRRGLSLEEAAALAPRVDSLMHGVALLMSRLDHSEKPNHAGNERQLGNFRDLRRLYHGVPASLANSSGLFHLGAKAHFDLARAGAALYGVNPTPGATNPMLSVLELRAHIVQVRNLAPGETIAEYSGLTVRRRTRLALVSVGYADGYPRWAAASGKKPQAIVGGRRCPIAAAPSMDLLPLDVTDLPNSTAARYGESATLIGAELGIDDVAAATGCTGRELLSRLGQRFHRIYYAT